MKIYVILAIAGIAFLYAISQFSSPPRVHLCNLWKYEGREVMVEGKVINRIGRMIEIREENYTVYVYSWDDKFQYGDEIRVTGSVGEKGENLIIYATEIKLIKKWNESVLSLPYLAENFQDYIGCNVRLDGYVYETYSSYFYLVDENDEYRIKVYYDNISFGAFQHVNVDGILKYNSHKMEFYLEGMNVK